MTILSSTIVKYKEPDSIYICVFLEVCYNYLFKILKSFHVYFDFVHVINKYVLLWLLSLIGNTVNLGTTKHNDCRFGLHQYGVTTK